MEQENIGLMPKEFHMQRNQWQYPHFAWVLLGIIVVILLDQWTKQMATDALFYGQPQYVLPVLDWTLLHNTGAAFSFLANAGGWQRWFFTIVSSVVSVAFFVWLCRLKPEEWILRYSLLFIIAGALGNLIDRVRFGYVVDFIHFHWNESYFPAFNIADMAISFGAILILLDMFFAPKKKELNAP